jgi:hypothetical protein
VSHIAKRSDMADIGDLIEAMARCGKGRPVAEVAQAALDLALGLWAMSDEVTQEMALRVVTSQIESRFRARSN